jgi:hypothetical protein
MRVLGTLKLPSQDQRSMPPEYDPPPTLLEWYIQSLGWMYTLLLPLSALIAFVLTVALLVFGKGRFTGAALLFIVPLPLLLGMLGTVDGMITSLQVIDSRTSAIPSYEVAYAASSSLATAVVGLWLTVPNWLLATVGLFIRALLRDPTEPVASASPPPVPAVAT